MSQDNLDEIFIGYAIHELLNQIGNDRCQEHSPLEKKMSLMHRSLVNSSEVDLMSWIFHADFISVFRWMEQNQDRSCFVVGVQLLLTCSFENSNVDGMFMILDKLPHPPVKVFITLTEIVVQAKSYFESKTKQLWSVYSNCLSQFIEKQEPIPTALIHCAIQCFAAVDAWEMFWRGLQLCALNDCLPTIELINVECLEQMLFFLVNHSGEIPPTSDFNVAALVKYFLAQYLEYSQEKGYTGPRIKQMCMTWVWLHFLEKGDFSYVQLIGGVDGTQLIPKTCPEESNTHIINVLKSQIQVWILSTHLHQLVSVMIYAYNILQYLEVSISEEFCKLPDNLPTFRELLTVADTQLSKCESSYAVEACRCCMASLALGLMRHCCNAEEWPTALQLHLLLSQHSFGHILLSQILPFFTHHGLEYLLRLFNAALQLNDGFILKELSKFPHFSDACNDDALRLQRFQLLYSSIQMTLSTLSFEATFAAFKLYMDVCEKAGEGENLHSLNFSELYNRSIVCCCTTEPYFHVSSALKMISRGFKTSSKCGLRLNPFTLRILIIASVRHALASPNALSTFKSIQMYVFDLVDRGINASIYSKIDTSQKTFLVPTDATTEELHVLLTTYCYHLKRELVRLMTCGIHVCLQDTELSIKSANVGQRDVDMIALYQIDVSFKGVIDRTKAVLQKPFFLEEPLSFTEFVDNNNTCLLLSSTDLYKCIYALKIKN